MTIVNYKEFMLMAHCYEEIPNMNGLFGKQRDGVTDAQKTFLHNLGIGTTGLKYKGQASKVIEIAVIRRQSGLATPGQMRTLCKHGIRDVHNISFQNAAKKISQFTYID